MFPPVAVTSRRSLSRPPRSPQVVRLSNRPGARLRCLVTDGRCQAATGGDLSGRDETGRLRHGAAFIDSAARRLLTAHHGAVLRRQYFAGALVSPKAGWSRWRHSGLKLLRRLAAIPSRILWRHHCRGCELQHGVFGDGFRHEVTFGTVRRCF